MTDSENGCALCPRECGADRKKGPGRCGCTDRMRIARVMLHFYEEPVISGTRGSGAIFFTGCPLGCAFCQNGEISRPSAAGSAGRGIDDDELCRIILGLQNDGAHNVNFVSPTPFTDRIIAAAGEARRLGLTVPVVWNTGGYEKAETIRALAGTADVFLTDFKFFDPAVSKILAGAEDYAKYATESLREMVRVAGKPVFGDDGMMKSGVIVRHLVLPGLRRDSEKVLRAVADAAGAENVLLSLMSQYTPDFFRGCGDPALDRAMRRRVTTFEYEEVRRIALELGFDGFMQERSSSVKDYTPEWDKNEENL
ncbi:MAG: radical SAM protein [Clostridia bacterium]|nr:radical SAM protein [Clostridia bacterium]